ncbi:M48 family metallopeptidase [Streptomyces sp. NPDC006458]|uniref:M48 family metallopeptidase n=1 Tax=Streptomyces sp. NPDC006458 TaxID=3154302 RepID=UPI0033BC3D01
MRAVDEGALQACPECRAEIVVDGRFTVWCAACDWNVDPGQKDEPVGRLERVRREMAARHGERLLDDVSGQGGESRGLDVFGVLSYGLALAVHAVTLALAAYGLWLLVTGLGGFGMVGGALLLLIAWSLRPRLGRLPKDGIVLRRPDAPELFGLIDQVGQVVGTRGVDAVVVDADINASVNGLGPRRRMLTLGLPLWSALTPQQRIALLGHELGHFVGGDTRHGLVVGSAYRSLALWHHYFAPVEATGWLQMLTNIAVIPFRLLVGGLLAVLDLLAVRATQRGEYLADSVAAKAASSEAAAGLMDRLLVSESVEINLRREVNARRMGGPARRRAQDAGQGLWEELAARVGEIPESEYERRRRVGERRGHSVDSTHPPTHLRRRRLLQGTPLPATVTADPEREARIAAELADARARVARELVRDGLDGH